jgi:hypothetical protein
LLLWKRKRKREEREEDTEEKHEETEVAQVGIWNAFVLGCLCHCCLCLHSLRLLRRGVCFGEIHLQDVPL